MCIAGGCTMKSACIISGGKETLCSWSRDLIHEVYEAVCDPGSELISLSLFLFITHSLSLISLCPSHRFALRPTLQEAFLSNFLLSVSSLSAEFRFSDGKLHKQFPPPAVEPFCPGSVWTPFQFPESILHRYFLPSYRPRLLTSPSLSFCVLVTVPV